ncbi:MAG: hypothetical protein ACKVY0_28945 [Prosthecobacter sp.]|uniref:hypothetical protein n=1 Tax=Prosthecobacter sp. TaxID=1965333 RepID=UPI0038FE6404
MKPTLLLLTLLLITSISALQAQIAVPGDGSDGALSVTASNLVIDLSQAITGTWDANNSANAGKGIFDPSKRAIIFKYSSVNIASGRTVTFTNHPSRAPVVWLVQGGVTLAGVLNLNGAVATNGANLPSEPGPGGFRGGAKGSLGTGAGLGIGGTNFSNGTYWLPASHAATYGNPSIVPLMGGSGSGPSNFSSGSGGGGAILIAAVNSILVSGSITSIGGGGSGGGSSGAIRLVANVINGSGSVDARDDGRIRLEANSVSGTLVTQPQTIAVPPATPPVIWPGNTAPTVKVVSVDTSAAPAVPTAPLDLTADIGISTNGATTVLLQTTNFPTTGLVQVRSAGKFANNATWTTAAFQSGDVTSATWTATVTFPTGFTTLQARATVP